MIAAGKVGTKKAEAGMRYAIKSCSQQISVFQIVHKKEAMLFTY